MIVEANSNFIQLFCGFISSDFYLLMPILSAFFREPFTDPRRSYRQIGASKLLDLIVDAS